MNILLNTVVTTMATPWYRKWRCAGEHTQQMDGSFLI